MGKRILLNKGVFAACLCITLIRIAQLVNLILQNGALPAWDVLFADFNNTYVGMFVAVPCLICAIQGFGNLLSWDKAVIRFRDRDSCLIGYAKLSMLVAIACSAWMSLMTLLSLLVICPSDSTTGHVLLLVLESSLLQAVFFIACACLFLMGDILSGNSAVASIAVFLYAAIDLIVAGIPQVASWFPALGWTIVQITNPYAVVPLIARAVFPLLLAIFSCSAALLAYRKRDFLEKAGARNDS